MVRILIPCLLTVGLSLACLSSRTAGADKDDKDQGLVPLFDGKSLAGWKVSAKSGHSRASKNKTGGRWVVEDGVIVGSQDTPGNGGIILTEKEYGNFEVALEMKNDF